MNEEKNIRISKVLKELNISLDNAVDFLKEKGIFIDSNINGKITETINNVLIDKFANDNANKTASQVINEVKRKEREILRIAKEKEDKERLIAEEKNIRISKVLKELDISLDRAVDFLLEKGIIIDSNINGKINENERNILYNKFSNKPKEILDIQNQLSVIIQEIDEKEEIVHEWKNENTYQCNKKREVVGLNLRNNKLKDITFLKQFKGLKILDLSNNELSNISTLEHLKELQTLDLSSNLMTNITVLEHLKCLQNLNLINTQLTDISVLTKSTGLKTIDLSCSQVKDFSILANLKELEIIDLKSNELTDISFLKNLKGLQVLNLQDNNLKDISALKHLISLQTLNLEYNQIQDISVLEYLINLRNLYLNGNKVSNISILENLKNLQMLYLSDNQLNDVFDIKHLKGLQNLDLSYNQIKEFLVFKKIVHLESLNHLNVYGNPFVKELDLKLDPIENHITTIKNEFSRFLEKKKIKVALPAKVLFLGNSNAGKSTFVDYFTQNTDTINKTINKLNSTPILQIVNYKIEEDNHNLPQAILFDFGGQDYYHGVYKAFLTNEAVNLIFWKKENDKNEIVPDREKENCFTQNFNRNYWIHQLNFFHHNKNKEQPIFLIQTNADKDKRDNFKGDFEQLNIENEYFVALTNESLKNSGHKNSLDYLVNSLISKINEKREEKEEPQWYIDFLEFVYNNKSEQSIEIEELKKYYNRQKDENLEKFFIDDLDQLSKKGFILFYKDNEKLHSKVWLNPTLTVKHIHKNILTQEILTQEKGKINFNDFNADDNIIELLKENKVIYLDVIEQKYIVPGYLPEAKQDNEDFFIFSDFNEVNFVMKFENFIPFGFMNQLVCKYGGNPEKKMYWKDQLIFTTIDKKAKVLINLDFEYLEIKVSIKKIKPENVDIKEIELDIFRTILYLYRSNESKIPLWKYTKINIPLFKQIKKNLNEVDGLEEEFNFFELSPHDLFISVNNTDFINHKLLQSPELTTTSIISYQRNEDGNLNKQNGKSISTINFKNFTTNPNIKNMKKIFISYSKDDLELVNQFQDHLSALKRDRLVGTWYCTKLLAGGEWDKDIQRHFDESDIICFMISSNLMRTDYIHKYEIANAFKKKEKNPTFKIIPIVLSFCSWSTKENNLSNYTALPYTAKPITDFRDKNMAWYITVECIRYMIEKNVNPEKEDFFDGEFLPTNIRKIYERIVRGDVDNNV